MGQSSQWAELCAVWTVAVNGAPSLTICTDSWAVNRGLTLWISTWHTNKWMVMHRSLWGQALWQDLWEIGTRNKSPYIMLLDMHHLLPLGNHETDTLAKVWWLEMVPTSPSGREVAQWLHHCLLHDGQKTMWSTIKTCGSPVTLAEAQEACETSVVCS